MAKRIVSDDITGTTLGQLRVQRFWIDENSKNMVEVRCACGTVLSVPLIKLYGKVGKKSCGCLRGSGGRHFRRTHGDTGSTEHGIWLHIKKRCYNPKDAAYALYGGRGIKVCDRWLDSYENFLSDMGRRPSLDHQLERRQNDQGYSPENCYWATRVEQGNNRRTNRLLTLNGQTMTMANWGRRTGISRITIKGRLGRGWSIERALTEPVHAECHPIHLEIPR